MKSSQVIVSQLLDHRALGLYSTAQMLSELWYFMPMTIATSAAPFIARQKRISEADYNNTFEQIFRFMWLLSIGLATLICLNSSFIVEILYGKAYAEAAAVLAVHTFTLIPVSIGVIQSLWLVNENKGKIAICQALVGAVASVLLNLYLIPKFGILGGAVAILISQTFQAFAVNALFVSELFKLQFRSLFSVLTSILEFFYTLCARCLSK
jgi:PST family polysaccharide transporter